MDIDFVPLAKNFLSKNKVSISDSLQPDELIQALSKHFEALVFNITSLAAMVAVIHSDKKIMPKHLIPAQAYIAYQCVGEKAVKNIKGGSKNTDTSVVDVEGIEMDEIAENCIDMDMRKYIHSIIAYQEISIGKGAMAGLLRILRSHMGCLLKDIRMNEPITMNRLQNIMSLRRHAVFH